MVKWKRDVIYGIALELVCLLCYISTRNLPAGTSKIWQTRPDVYIWLWLIILAVLAAVMIAGAVLKRDQTPCEPIWSKAGVVTIIAFFLYLFAMNYLGFTLSTAIFLVCMILYYSRKMDKLNATGAALVKKVVLYVVIAVVIAFITKWVFTAVLDVRLPAGRLF